MLQGRTVGLGGDRPTGGRRYSFLVVVAAAAAVSCAGCGGGSTPQKATSPGSAGIDSPGDSDSQENASAGRSRDRGEEQQRSPQFVVRLERDLDMHETAARALGRIGEAAVPELQRALTDVDPSVRIQAAEVLARIGPEAEAAVPDLIAALEDENEEVRKAAARALGQIGPAAAAAVPALMRSMRQSDELLPPSRPNG
jgi:HEAT repeat protein